MAISEGQKWMISLWSALLFLLVAAPFTFKFTGAMTKLVGWVSSTNGCPNWTGLLLHAVVFAVLIRVLMLIPLPKVK